MQSITDEVRAFQHAQGRMRTLLHCPGIVQVREQNSSVKFRAGLRARPCAAKPAISLLQHPVQQKAGVKAPRPCSRRAGFRLVAVEASASSGTGGTWVCPAVPSTPLVSPWTMSPSCSMSLSALSHTNNASEKQVRLGLTRAAAEEDMAVTRPSDFPCHTATSAL